VIAPLLSMAGHQFWYLMPLLVVVSMVYAATRHEDMLPIFGHAVRFAFWIIGFMLVVMVVLLLLGRLV
jgi:hypothetical protein